MSKGKVVVLGLNGHLGRFIAQAFASAGWDVTGMARSDKHKLPGVRFVKGDADSVEDMRRAIGDVDLVVNALNVTYHLWHNGRKEAQMARVLEAMGTSGKTMLFPGNIYNYAASDRVVTPDLLQRPQTERGAIRVRVEQMFEAAAARGDIQVLIIRAGDFFAPRNGGNDWFEAVMFSAIRKNKVQLVGTRNMGHSWAYLPDLGRAFEAVGALRRTLGPSETFHFAGHYVTPERMGEAIVRAAAPRRLKIGQFPHVLLRLIGLFNAELRAVAKMDYLWRNPMELRDERLERLLGPGFGTPFDDAIAATIQPFLDESAASAQKPLPQREATAGA